MTTLTLHIDDETRTCIEYSIGSALECDTLTSVSGKKGISYDI